MADPNTPEWAAQIEARIKQLEESLNEALQRRMELATQNQTLSQQVNERTTQLIATNAGVFPDMAEEEEAENVLGVPSHQADQLLRSADAPTMRRLLQRFYDIAVWAQASTPDTLAETFGDISADLKRAEELLREE